MQSDQGLHCLLTVWLDTIEYMNGQQKPMPYFVHVQDDLNLHILRMFEGNFSLDAAHIIKLSEHKIKHLHKQEGPKGPYSLTWVPLPPTIGK